MPEYTSGYLCKDGRFFKYRETAKNHEIALDAEEYLAECFNLDGTKGIHVTKKDIVQALLVRYDFEERSDYAKLCRDEEIAEGEE